MTNLERFYSHVSKTESCWLWTGTLDKDGYGRFWWNGRTRGAARFIFEWTYGPLAPGKLPCHNCDTPRCVRPDHLFAGTQSENIRDAVIKGRWPQGQQHGVREGEQNGNHTLTTQQVQEIRRHYRPGHAPFASPASQRALAEKYGVSKYAIYAIIHGLTWCHLSQETPSP